MRKAVLISIVFLILGAVLVSAATSYNFLTKGFADTLYCSITGSNCGGASGVTPMRWRVNGVVVGTLDENGTLKIRGDLITNNGLGNPGLLYELYVDNVLSGEFDSAGNLYIIEDFFANQVLNERGIIIRYMVDNNFQSKINQTGTFFIRGDIITNQGVFS